MTKNEELISTTVLNIHRDLLKSVVDNMETFITESKDISLDVKDFTDFAIISAAFVMSIKELDNNINPKMSSTIIEMLQNDKKKSIN